ncbi:MAG: amino acid--tRNA ligase-related protein, partial [Thermoguttaceae bacterium]
MNDALDFRPSASWDSLRLRAGLLRRLREFFHGHGFLEVETPLLCSETVVDRHIEPFEVDCAGRKMWLQTSPEFAMKRLLAAGAKAIYQVTRSIRQGERGPLHNPEFTIVEWYRTADGMEEGMRFTGELCQT